VTESGECDNDVVVTDNINNVTSYFISIQQQETNKQEGDTIFYPSIEIIVLFLKMSFVTALRCITSEQNSRLHTP